jgi:hypothetical protein
MTRHPTPPHVTPDVIPDVIPDLITDLITGLIPGLLRGLSDLLSPAGLIGVAAGGAAAGLTLAVGHTVVSRVRHAHRARHASLVVITPPPEVDPTGARVFWTCLPGLLRRRWWTRWLQGRLHVAVEYQWVARQLTIAVWAPAGVPTGPLQAAIHGAWPGAACTVTAPPPAATPPPTGGDALTHALTGALDHALGHALGRRRGRRRAAGVVVRGGALLPVLPPWYSLEVDHTEDPLRTLLALTAGLHATETACVQVLARPATTSQRARVRRGVQGLRAGHPVHGPVESVLDPGVWLAALTRLLGQVLAEVLGPTRRTTTTSPAPTRRPVDPVLVDPRRERDTRAGVDKLADGCWEVAIRFAVTTLVHPRPRAAGTLAARGGRGSRAAARRRVRTLILGIRSAFVVWAGRNQFRAVRVHHPARVLTGRRLRRGFLLSTTELASVAALPRDLAVPGLERARARPMPAPVTVAAGGRAVKVLGRAQIGGHSVGVKTTDARHHLHVLGSTGSGKSTLLVSMILDDVHAGRGVVVIDPKGDLVTDVLDRIPPTTTRRLGDRFVVLDPDQPPGTTLNPLALTGGLDADVIVDNVVSIFSRIFAKHWGPRIDDVMRVACLTLMRHPDPTLTLIPPLLNDRKIRHHFTETLDDPEGLRGFWEWFETSPAALRAQVIGPVLARLRSLLLRDFVKRTFGTPTSSFDMAKVLDGGVLLARLPKGQVGEDTSRLLGSFVLASVWQTATARARLPEAQRRDACVYVDEAHNFLNLPGSVADMLAEARGYYLGLVLAHQNLTQMPRETQLALSANARNKVIFACAPEDAHQLARHTHPELHEHDLSHLDAYQAAARLLVDGRETPAFTLHTTPPRPAQGHTHTNRQIAAAATTRPDTPTTERHADHTGTRTPRPTPTRDSGRRQHSGRGHPRDHQKGPA